MGLVGRIRFPGSLPSGEIFQYAFHVVHADASPMGLSDVVAAANAFQNALKTGGTPITSLYSPSTVWALPICEVLASGSNHVEARGFGTVSMVGTAAGGSTVLPPGVAIAVTLRTHGSGPKFRGRFYLPPPYTTAVGTTGRMTSAAFTTLTSALANAFTVLNGLSPSVLPAIYHRTDHTVDPCQRGDVGDVFDSQRTRRDKLIEARNSLFSY
jgi:hypothetical protein